MVHHLLFKLLALGAAGAAGYCIAKKGQHCEKCCRCHDKLAKKDVAPVLKTKEELKDQVQKLKVARKTKTTTNDETIEYELEDF